MSLEKKYHWIFNHIFEEDKNLGAFILEAEE